LVNKAATDHNYFSYLPTYLPTTMNHHPQHN